jgi:hypothetical protein
MRPFQLESIKWLIEDQAFLPVVLFGASPTPSPIVTGRASDGWGRGRGCGRSLILRLRGSLVLIQYSLPTAFTMLLFFQYKKLKKLSEVIHNEKKVVIKVQPRTDAPAPQFLLGKHLREQSHETVL